MAPTAPSPKVCSTRHWNLLKVGVIISYITKPENQISEGEAEYSLTFTGRIASWSARHRWWVIAASVLVLVLAMFASGTVETKLLDDNELGEGDSGKAIRLLDERFDDGGAPTEQLVFSNPSLDVDDPAYRSTVEELIEELRALPEVSTVVSYYEVGDPRLVSADRSVLRAQVELADTAGSDDDQIDAILETVYAARPEAGPDGFYIGMAGDQSVLKQKEELSEEDLSRVFIVTSASRGSLKTEASQKHEFLEMIRGTQG